MLPSRPNPTICSRTLQSSDPDTRRVIRRLSAEAPTRRFWARLGALTISSPEGENAYSESLMFRRTLASQSDEVFGAGAGRACPPDSRAAATGPAIISANPVVAIVATSTITNPLEIGRAHV